MFVHFGTECRLHNITAQVMDVGTGPADPAAVGHII